MTLAVAAPVALLVSIAGIALMMAIARPPARRTEMPLDFASRQLQHEKRWATTNFVGGWILGYLCGTGSAAFIAFVCWWLSVGGAP